MIRRSVENANGNEREIAPISVYSSTNKAIVRRFNPPKSASLRIKAHHRPQVVDMNFNRTNADFSLRASAPLREI
jgi:hypothetical protein